MKALLLVMAVMFSPQEFLAKTEGLIEVQEATIRNCQFTLTQTFYGYTVMRREYEKSFQLTIIRDELPKYQIISIATKEGLMVLVAKEWINGIPVNVYKNPNKKLLGVVGEEEA